MKVLKAIGRFFARIGRWIRDTAWVQPLLIVGGIFAIIFSIPYITNWVKSWFQQGDLVAEFYSSYALSWDGIKNGETGEGHYGTSQVDNMFKYLSGDADSLKSTYGEKFFLCLVQKECTGCASNYKGFKYLRDKWNTGTLVPTNAGEQFKIWTIYVDEFDADAPEREKMYFEKYITGLDTARYDNFFTTASELFSYNRERNNLDSKFEAIADKPTTPLTFLVDMNAGTKVKDSTDYGVTEVVWEIPGKDGGTSDLDLARSLMDCWNHEGDYAKSSK